jgi:hypothetical protein
VAFYALPIQFLFVAEYNEAMVVMAVESQTLQFNSHKMLLNNLVRDVLYDTGLPSIFSMLFSLARDGKRMARD